VFSEYTVQCNSASITVVDSVPARDGTDTLISIEELRFADQFVDCTWQDLGGGTVGSHGAVSLTGNGSLVGGSVAGLDLTNAPPGVLSLAWLSFTSVPLPAFSGTVFASPFSGQFLFLTNGSGALSLGTTWPTGIPAGTEVWFQFLVSDPSVIWDITLSNAVKATTP